MSAFVLASLRTYPLTSRITDAFSASVSPVSRRQPRACSNQATSLGRTGSPLIGTRSTQGWAYMTARIAQARADSPSRHPLSAAAGTRNSRYTVSTISATSSFLADTYR